MNQGFEELNKAGLKGIAAFWLRCLLFVLSLSISAFSFFWISKSSSKIWLKAVNGGLLTANVFLAVTSLASFAFLLLSRLNIKIIYSIQFTHHLFAILSFIGQIICCILMSLATPSSAESYLNSINDYCSRNNDNPIVVAFIKDHPTQYAIYAYVASRSTDLYPSISAFFGIWFASTIIYLICAGNISERPEQSPLLQDHHSSLPSASNEQNEPHVTDEHSNEVSQPPAPAPAPVPNSPESHLNNSANQQTSYNKIADNEGSGIEYEYEEEEEQVGS